MFNPLAPWGQVTSDLCSELCSAHNHAPCYGEQTTKISQVQYVEKEALVIKHVTPARVATFNHLLALDENVTRASAVTHDTRPQHTGEKVEAPVVRAGRVMIGQLIENQQADC